MLSLDRGESATVDLDFYVTLKKNTGTFGIMINYCDVVVEVRLWGWERLVIGARIELLMMVFAYTASFTDDIPQSMDWKVIILY